jgi:HEAT repeat protein
MTLAPLFALEPEDRAAALARLSPNEAGAVWAVRALLLEDEHAPIRAAAADWMGRAGARAQEAALRDALYDSHETVRLAACRALRRASLRGALPLLSRLALEEPVWSVRRAAVMALASLDGPRSVPLLLQVLDDPFWRVRRAAAAALVALGAKVPLPLVDPGALSERAEAAYSYVRRKVGLPAAEIPGRDASPQLSGELADADPAVVAARLERGLPASVAELVLYLGDSHEELRFQARRRLARSNDLRALSAATLWLAEPRIPKAAGTVMSLLDGLEPRVSDDLSLMLLSDMDAHPFATMWALSKPPSRGTEGEWRAALVRAARAKERVVRRGAAQALGDAEANATSAYAREELGRLLSDDDEDVRRVAAFALASSPNEAAWRLLVAEVDPAEVAAEPLLSRPVALAAAALGDVSALRRAASSTDSATRAVALQALFDVAALRGDEIEAARANEDPSLRLAVLDESVALACLESDVHPPLRRAAFDVLVGTPNGLLAARVAASSDDPWLRARGAERLARSLDPADTAIVLGLLEDPHPAVRAAARDVTLRSEEARAVLTRRVAAAAPSTEASTARRQATPPRSPFVTASPRPLGRTGMEVSPLVVSGANEPSIASLFAARRAGVNAFFWEPRYRSLTTFLGESALRGDRPLVVAGSYHASDRGIRRDLERACATLGRDRIDVFLLFWARSPARLEGEAPRALARAREQGRIGAAGFSTHDRLLAEQAMGNSLWDGVMVRHSAAHPGAEESLFAAASRAGAFVLTFSATSYGRLLRGGEGTPPTADECYRYSLSQSGVTACVSAPRGGAELIENLAVLGSPSLAEARMAELRAHGRVVHVESRDFTRHIRRFPTQPENLEREIDRIDDDFEADRRFA